MLNNLIFLFFNHCKTIENKFFTPKQFLDIKKKKKKNGNQII